MVFQKREDLLNLLGEDFYQYYRRNRNNRYNKLTTPSKVNAMVQRLFAEMHFMLNEYNHGIALKNFGVISPKEFLYEDRTSIFKVKYKKRTYYNVFLEDEYLNSKYRTLLRNKYYKNKVTDVTKVKKPRPNAVLLHRKRIRKNNYKTNG
jgi:hypothetical protein